MEANIWLLICVLLLLVELATMGLTTIWFAIGALAAFIIAILGGSFILQFIALIAVSIVMLVFTRPLAVKHINSRTTKTNVDELHGKIAVVTEEINNMADTGRASLNGMPWTARSKDPAEIIPVGERVVVVNITGVRLIVELYENQEV